MNFAFLDSGTGGIPYMLRLKRLAPDATCAYLADTVHFPYGEKTVPEIIEYATAAVSRVIDMWRPETIVVACNTISVSALASLRERFPFVPFIGTVPAIKLAASVTKNKKIGLLATNATVRDAYIRELEKGFASGCTIYSRGDADLVSFIERKLVTADENEKMRAVMPAVGYFAEKGCDTIVLGCTHFTHLADIMQKAAGKNVNVVDSRDGVARHAIEVHDNFINSKKESENIFTAAADFLSEVPDGSFFVTGISDDKAKAYYEAFCKMLAIPFGGILPVI
ncbi:MAG: glutamate racemase [Treponema socranskii subsp. buccale]